MTAPPALANRPIPARAIELELETDADIELDAEDVLVVRRGPGANCSSIGSALDILFLTAAALGVILVAAAAAFGPRTGAGANPEKKDDARED